MVGILVFAVVILGFAVAPQKKIETSSPEILPYDQQELPDIAEQQSSDTILPSTVQTTLGEGGGLAGIVVIPKKVLEDSRCPSDVQCIQQGTVRVQALVTSGSILQTMEFSLGDTAGSTVDGKTIRLVGVLPDSGTSESRIKEVDYRFVFEIK